MAKKPKAKYSLEFLGTDIKYEDIKLVIMPTVEGQESKFWLEFEGTRARLLVSKAIIGEFIDDQDTLTIKYARDGEAIGCELECAGGQFVMTKYITILGKPTAKQFYYLDEYQPHQLRLCHSEHFFPEGFEHNTVEGYEIRKVLT